jgi:hypothetical protein
MTQDFFQPWVCLLLGILCGIGITIIKKANEILKKLNEKK